MLLTLELLDLGGWAILTNLRGTRSGDIPSYEVLEQVLTAFQIQASQLAAIAHEPLLTRISLLTDLGQEFHFGGDCLKGSTRNLITVVKLW